LSLEAGCGKMETGKRTKASDAKLKVINISEHE